MSDTNWSRHAERLLKITPSPGVIAADLADALALGTPRTLKPEETMCWEGSPGDELYVLLRGTLSVQHEEPGSGRMRELVRVGAPSIAGHMALIDGSKRSATCVAVDHVEVAVLSADLVRRLLEESSPRGGAFRRLLLTTLSLQLTGANRRIAHLAAASQDEPALQPADQDRSTRGSETEQMLRIAGLLEGWTGPIDELDEVEWVPQEQLPRTHKKRW